MMSRRWYLRLFFCIVLTFIVSCVIVVQFENRKLRSTFEPFQKLAEDLNIPEPSKLRDFVKNIHRNDLPVAQLVGNISRWSNENLPTINKTFQSLKSVFKNEINSLFVKPISSELAKTDMDGVNYNVHIFYYPWYGNQEFDQKWLHWNHRRISHWKKEEMDKYSTDAHIPEEDVAADFYPELGPYSSKDPSVVAQHMKWIRQSGAGVLVVSWYPPNTSDDSGQPLDPLFPALLDAAEKENLKIVFHMEPYTGRKIYSFLENLKYIVKTYGNHPALFKTKKHGKMVPVYYIYDSYTIPFKEWMQLLAKSGDLSVRGTELDGFFLGLLVEFKHRVEIKKAGFDGFYTYFAAEGFTFGSSWKNWRDLSNFARQNSLAFVPSVGPGYIDAQVRPWNGENTRGRKNGKFYTVAWKTAISSNPTWISVTSFNEWHEGSQIEPAVPKAIEGREYMSYLPKNSTFYLQQTKMFASEFSASQKKFKQ